MAKVAVCLMGPTASGKTDVAVELCERHPFEIISVDSALVYRGMDIGTAKPDADVLRRAPHRLVNIRDPEDSYSAGEFVRDARAEMESVFAAGNIPLLVGGTMLYFRALTEGIAQLPSGDAEIRAQIDLDAEESGWPAIHQELAQVDPEAAARINPNDSQRIQRALEVFRISGISLSEWQREAAMAHQADDIDYVKAALTVEPRSVLHERIQQRLNSMINNDFESEVRSLMSRERLTAVHPSMRSVGYRQFWEYLDGSSSLDVACDKALFATRQLAKRQLTWLRSETNLKSFDALDPKRVDAISDFLASELP